MDYYYMDGLEKKGPYTKEELKLRMLPPETLLIKNGMTHWGKLESFEEFNEPDTNLEPFKSIKSSNSVETNEQQKKIKISHNIFLYLGIFASLLVSFTIVFFQKNYDLVSFNKKINEIMGGKSSISDYSYAGTEGKLLKVYDAGFDPIFNLSLKEDNVVKTENHVLAYKPNDNIKKGDNSYYWNEEKRKYWDLFKDLKEYYESEPYSGFTALKLERFDDIFTVKYIWSGDMGYKVSTSIHYDGYSSEYFKSPGYDIPTYRPSVGKCYEEAAKYLTVEDKDKSYLEGSYKKIDRFEYMESDFYKINQLYPKYYKGLDTVFVEDRIGEKRGHILDDEKITNQTSRNDGHVFSSQWIVWYKDYTNRYLIVEKKYAQIKYFAIYTLIGICLTFFTFFIFKYRKKVEFK